jgi:hypothetical protein
MKNKFQYQQVKIYFLHIFFVFSLLETNNYKFFEILFIAYIIDTMYNLMNVLKIWKELKNRNNENYPVKNAMIRSLLFWCVLQVLALIYILYQKHMLWVQHFK